MLKDQTCRVAPTTARWNFWARRVLFLVTSSSRPFLCFLMARSGIDRFGAKESSVRGICGDFVSGIGGQMQTKADIWYYVPR